MPVIESRIDVNAAAYTDNRADMLARIKVFRDAEQRVRDNSERGRAKFESRGQLMPRDRLALLLDRGAPFVELSTLAGFERHDDDGKDNASGGGVITGIGFVSGLRCVVLVHDAAIKGGAITPGGLSKVLRAQDIALINKLPVVVLAESAGANLLYQSEIFVAINLSSNYLLSGGNFANIFSQLLLIFFSFFSGLSLIVSVAVARQRRAFSLASQMSTRRVPFV